MIVEQDVADALNSGRIAWATREARIRLIDAVTENVKRYIEGDPINIVNG